MSEMSPNSPERTAFNNSLLALALDQAEFVLDNLSTSSHLQLCAALRAIALARKCLVTERVTPGALMRIQIEYFVTKEMYDEGNVAGTLHDNFTDIVAGKAGDALVGRDIAGDTGMCFWGQLICGRWVVSSVGEPAGR
jgi:hypothetical protein